MSRPSLREILEVIAEVEGLERTLAEFPGLTRAALSAILLAQPKQLELLPVAEPRAKRARDGERPEAEASDPPKKTRKPKSAAEPEAEPRKTRSQAGEAGTAERKKPRASGEAPRVLSVWTDGASRGNPGPASIGAVLRTGGETVAELSERLGIRTNNYAEYEAVRRALEAARALGAKRIELHADSELVIRQLSGVYRVKHPDLLPLFEAVKKLERAFPEGVTYKHVRREQNQDADALANLALDR